MSRLRSTIELIRHIISARTSADLVLRVRKTRVLPLDERAIRMKCYWVVRGSNPLVVLSHDGLRGRCLTISAYNP